MKIKLAGWVVIILLGAIIVGVLWYLFLTPKAVPQTVPEPVVTLPASGSVTSVTTVSATSSPTVRTMPLAAQNGAVVTTKDFIHNGVTLSDAANPGNYMLAGNLGYCLSNPQQCQAAPSTNFTVYYNGKPQSFTITLEKEPIGQARLDMEQFMLITLRITEQQMCSLNYLVAVTRYVNPQYTGKNLGFSFCPGATVLPK